MHIYMHLAGKVRANACILYMHAAPKKRHTGPLHSPAPDEPNILSIYPMLDGTDYAEQTIGINVIDDLVMKALKCKTLGGIHMQSTAGSSYGAIIIYTRVVYILRMRVRVPRCPE